jgi:hypothetical protein
MAFTNSTRFFAYISPALAFGNEVAQWEADNATNKNKIEALLQANKEIYQVQKIRADDRNKHQNSEIEQKKQSPPINDGSFLLNSFLNLIASTN